MTEYEAERTGGRVTEQARNVVSNAQIAIEYFDDAMKAMGEALSLVGKVVADYRKHLVDGGMSDEIADRLAIELNTRLMDQSFAKVKPPEPFVSPYRNDGSAP